jgi:hypothetical protein
MENTTLSLNATEQTNTSTFFQDVQIMWNDGFFIRYGYTLIQLGILMVMMLVVFSFSCFCCCRLYRRSRERSLSKSYVKQLKKSN